MYLKDNRVDTIVDLIKKYGGGTPQGGEPFQQLVTDADGKAVWEEKPFYQEMKQAFEPITWESTMTGLEEFSIDMGSRTIRYYKVCEYFPLPSGNAVESYTLKISAGGETMEDTQKVPANIVEGGWLVGEVITANEKESVLANGITIRPGVWFVDFASMSGMPTDYSSLTLNPTRTVETKLLEPKYLNEALRFGAEYAPAFETLSYDGNKEGKESLIVYSHGKEDWGIPLIKVSNSPIPITEVSSFVITDTTNGSTTTHDMSMGYFDAIANEHGGQIRMDGYSEGVYVVASDGQFVIDNQTFSAGTWVQGDGYSAGSGYVSKVESKTVIVDTKPLDEKYMPTLTSPNGTKYRLTVADDGTLSATAV